MLNIESVFLSMLIIKNVNHVRCNFFDINHTPRYFDLILQLFKLGYLSNITIVQKAAMCADNTSSVKIFPPKLHCL